MYSSQMFFASSDVNQTSDHVSEK